jgi:hypothetical protein
MGGSGWRLVLKRRWPMCGRFMSSIGGGRRGGMRGLGCGGRKGEFLDISLLAIKLLPLINNLFCFCLTETVYETRV